MLRKISIGVDCADDAERDKVQEIANALTATAQMNGKQAIAFYHLYMQHRGKAAAVFNFIKRNGLPGPIAKMMGV